MKLLPAQVPNALRNSAAYSGLLIYGMDRGLVRTRALAAIRVVTGGVANSFQLSTLAREEQARLREEATSLSLGGGRRVVHVQDAGDALVPVLDKLKIRPADTLIVLEAGELTPRSKLRAWAERAPAWGAIPCFISSSGAIVGEIQAALAQSGMVATSDALAFLGQELSGDSVTRQSELDKLTLFASGSRTVDLNMAQSSCTLSVDASVGAAVSAALAGQSASCDAAIAELSRDGATGPGVLAVLSNQVQRMLMVRLMIDSGQSAEDACRTLLPPLYPRQMAAFLRDVQRWRTPALEALGRAIRDADIACKTAGSSDMTIAGRLLATVAARAGT